MTAARGLRVLSELVPLIEARKIVRNRREWDAPVKAWESAITGMLERRAQLTLPLRSHGYLLEVVVGLANQVEAKAESDLEKQRRTEIDRPPPVASIATPAFNATRFAEIRRQQEARDAELQAQQSAHASDRSDEKAARRERMKQAEQEIEQRKGRGSDARPLAECVPPTVIEKR